MSSVAAYVYHNFISAERNKYGEHSYSVIRNKNDFVTVKKNEWNKGYLNVLVTKTVYPGAYKYACKCRVRYQNNRELKRQEATHNILISR